MPSLPSLALLAATTVAASLVVAHSTAHACGGCFHQKNDVPSVVTDHRMALSVSKTQTILWDQVRYQGNPAEFAWVLPVGPGARVELARAEWLAALDVATAPQISAPEYTCPNGSRSAASPNTGGGGGGGGCGGGGVDYAGFDNTTAPPTDFQSTGDVTVVNQSVVGPYLAVVVRSDSGVAISSWLDSNGFEIPSAVAPMLASYASAKLDFLALRLRPNVGVQAMQPVRVITPGADPTLPLRMVAAGTGARVGLLLYVIGEGRYEAASYANATVNPSLVRWDAQSSRSNYTELFEGLTSTPEGAWVTEYAGHSGFADAQSAYRAACSGRTIQVRVPCKDLADGGADADAEADGDTDAGDVDADHDGEASTVTDAETDAQTDADAGVDAGHECFETHPACDVFDDDKVSTDGMYLTDVHLTRLRTTLSTTGLVELRLAGTGAGDVASRIAATEFSVPPVCTPASSSGCACDSANSPRSALVPGALAIAALALLRRRRRER